MGIALEGTISALVRRRMGFRHFVLTCLRKSLPVDFEGTSRCAGSDDDEGEPKMKKIRFTKEQKTRSNPYKNRLLL
jgi:hypothetical protein